MEAGLYGPLLVVFGEWRAVPCAVVGRANGNGASRRGAAAPVKAPICTPRQFALPSAAVDVRRRPPSTRAYVERAVYATSARPSASTSPAPSVRTRSPSPA